MRQSSKKGSKKSGKGKGSKLVSGTGGMSCDATGSRGKEDEEEMVVTMIEGTDDEGAGNGTDQMNMGVDDPGNEAQLVPSTKKSTHKRK